MIYDFEVKGKINTETEDDAFDLLFYSLDDIVSKKKVTVYCKDGMAVEK